MISLVILYQTFVKFPSPYGVIFILMNSNFLFQDLRFGKGFPSPYGVIFILTDYERHNEY